MFELFSILIKKILIIFVLIVSLISVILALEWYEKKRALVVGYFSTHQISTVNNADNYLLAGYPVDLINMTLATEDQIFLSHKGVDIKEVLSAFKEYIFNNKRLRGASTISQQLIKNTLLSPERTLKRKLLEMVMTFILEDNFSKEFILANYMNRVYLGKNGAYTIYGFKYGAYYYFKKNPNKMTLTEMAQLVAMLKGPSYYHPIQHPQRLKKRQELVLKIFKKYNNYHGKYTRN